jgi:hypothetical protein
LIEAFYEKNDKLPLSNQAQVNPPRPDPQDPAAEPEELLLPSVAKVDTCFSVLYEPHWGHST